MIESNLELIELLLSGIKSSSRIVQKQLNAHRVIANKWPLLARLPRATRAKVRMFKYWHDRIYCILDERTIVAAGNNSQGLLGLGHKNGVHRCQEIVELRDKTIVDIVLGGNFVVVLTKSGQVYAWGDNVDGQLGIEDDNCTVSLKPVQVKIITNIVMVKCGYNHVMALDHRGRLYTWADNDEGQLGSGTEEDESLPHLTKSKSAKSKPDTGTRLPWMPKASSLWLGTAGHCFGNKRGTGQSVQDTV